MTFRFFILCVLPSDSPWLLSPFSFAFCPYHLPSPLWFDNEMSTKGSCVKNMAHNWCCKLGRFWKLWNVEPSWTIYILEDGPLGLSWFCIPLHIMSPMSENPIMPHVPTVNEALSRSLGPNNQGLSCLEL